MKASSYESGRVQGRAARRAIEANLRLFALVAPDLRHLRDRAVAAANGLSDSVRSQIEGLADGSQQPFFLLLVYNLFRDSLFADGCTVMAGLGSASANGHTVFMKNSDQLGNDAMVGPNFHLNKEIYVVQVTRADNGRRIVGLSAAGSTGIKVGASDAGVAAGSNIARTVELAQRNVDVSRFRASDRTQLLREGLEEETALAASQRILAKTMSAPTTTPGNIEFADSRECWILETSYGRYATQVVRDASVARANRFQVLEALNEPADESSRARYQRCLELLEQAEKSGGIRLDDLIEFSQDHANGAGLNSICRHGDDYREETSLGAGAIEITPEPRSSRIALALGKPCHAWANPNSRIELTPDADLGDVPASFVDGNAWRLSYSEEPYEAPVPTSLKTPAI